MAEFSPAPAVSNESRHSARIALIALGLAILGAAAMLAYHQLLFLPLAHQVSAGKGLGGGYEFGNDFYPLWLTSREALRVRNPYSVEITRQIQIGLFGRVLDQRRDPRDLRMFAHPAYTLLVIWPVAQIRFEVARIFMGILLLAMTLVSVVLWMRALTWRVRWPWMLIALLLSVCNYPALEGLYAEQLGLVVAFLLALAVVLLQRGHLLIAGVLLALTWMKPQIAALLTLYVLLWSLCEIRKRTRLVAGFFATILLLTGAALLVWPHWIQQWLRVLVQYHDYSEPSLLSGFAASLLWPRLALPAAVFLTTGAIILALALAWSRRRAAADSFSFMLTVSVLLAITTIAVLPGQAVYDHVILLPGILLVIRERRQLRRLGRTARLLFTVGALVLFWPWTAALALIVANAAHATLAPTSILALPIRTAASLPFAVLALLAWVLRSSMRPQPSGLESQALPG